jgi:hypothetical protein
MPLRGRGAFPQPDAVHRDVLEHPGSLRSCIGEYRALKKLPRSDHALSLLRSVGAAVQPIMVKHGWRLPLLVEMYPKTSNLLGLNVNKGQKIALRLRRPYDQADFLDEQSIIETMLHELAHNLRGPHDEIFFSHLERLTEEWYELRSSGRLAGQGFFVPGTVLGGSTLNPHSSRLLRMPAPSSATPQRLGGTSDNVSPQHAAAQAAERRRAITAACPSNNSASTLQASDEQAEEERLHGVEVIVIDDDDDDIDATATKAAENKPSITHIELDDDDDDGDDDVVFVHTRKATQPTILSSVPRPGQLTRQTQDAAALRASLMQGDNGQLVNLESQARSTDIDGRSRAWSCQRCTLLNTVDSLRCSACDAIRPGTPHWSCRSCAHVMLGSFAEFWCCSRCGTIKVA